VGPSGASRRAFLVNRALGRGGGECDSDAGPLWGLRVGLASLSRGHALKRGSVFDPA